MKLLLFAMLLGMPLAVSAQDVEINETNFPDENFRSYLLEQNYGADGVLTEEERMSVRRIDVSTLGAIGKEISSLKGIEYFTALTELNCGYNRLTTLDVSKNTALTGLYCGSNQLTTLDMSNNTALIHLHCFDNQLTALDVSENTALSILGCANNPLTALNVSGCTALTFLSCDHTQLTTLDVSNNISLINLHCNDNPLTSLNVSNDMALTELWCYHNQIQGAAMDYLIDCLPQTKNGEMRMLYDNSSIDEGNVCTKAQVAAAKAKGWIVYYYAYTDVGAWLEYEGSEDNSDTSTIIAQPTKRTEETDTPAYTLSGQKVTGSLKNKKGIYVVGGKKIVVK